MALPTVECFRGMDIIDQLTAIYEASLQLHVIEPGIFNYIRPDGVSLYFRPDGTSLYKRPA